MGAEVERLADPLDSLAELSSLRVGWATEDDVHHGHDDPFTQDFAAWLTRESAHRVFWLARVEGSPVGMVNLLVFDRMPTVARPSGGWGYLCNMYVDAAHRNDGVGAQLASAVLDFADATGLERVVLSPSERSRPFWASLGFGPADNLLVRPNQA